MEPDQPTVEGLETLNVSQTARETIDFLDVEGHEKNYLLAFNAQETDGKVSVLTLAAKALRESISPDNPMGNKANDRLTGLQIAYEELSRFTGDQLLREGSNFAVAMRNHARGLVDEKTQLTRKVRKEIGK